MNKNKAKNFLYIISAVALSTSFVIKLIVDTVNRGNSKCMGNILPIEILVCTTVFSMLFFSFFFIIQYKIENRKNILSCIYNNRYLCCLLNNNYLNDFFEESTELINDVELAKYEQQVQTKEIWLLSSDLSVESGDNIFKEVVKTRLNEGVQYSFVALDSPLSRERARKIKNQYKSLFANKRIHFYLIEGNEYSLFLSLYALAIYNPSDNLENTQAYVCVGESGGSNTSIYAKLNQIHTQTATNITREIIRTTEEFIP